MITVEEKNIGTSGNSEGWKREYIATATDTDADITEFALVEYVALQIPDAIDDGNGGTIYLDDVSTDRFMVTPAGPIAFLSSSYVPASSGSARRRQNTTPIGEAIYEFSYQAPAGHIYFALSQDKFTRTDGDDIDFGLRIKVNSHGETEGLDLPGGSTTNTWRLSIPQGFVSPEYEAMVESLMGSVNVSTFKGRPAGSMRFVHCASTQSSKGTIDITWGFQFSENILGISIDGITFDKKGHDVIWQYDEQISDTTTKVAIPKARAMFVAQVFPYADLTQLGF